VSPIRPQRRLLSTLRTVVASVLVAITTLACSERVEPIPHDLADTGLYADIASHTLASDVLAFEPQYPLWTDGAVKHRWIRVPPGASIDASDPDHLVFPIGTRLWKEFAFERRVETRFLELAADGEWRFATYLWSPDERGATLAPERGVPAACESAPGVPYDVPGRNDCLACHTAGPNRVLGFTPLQLSPDRDPLAPHTRVLPSGALDLCEFVRRGLVRNLPQQFVETPPRIAASTPRERAALGYLSSNCGTCHTSAGSLAGLGLDLSYSLSKSAAAAIDTTLDRPSQFRWPSDTDPLRIAPSTADLGVLPRRMASRQPLSQMPPLGTHLRDADALALVTEWIREDLGSARRLATTPAFPQPQTND
jgi:mono/diheme cytochrome c family protein